MTEPSAHVDTFVRDKLPPRRLWPEMDYSVLPELATYPPRLNAAGELLDRAVANGFGGRPALYWGDEIWSYADLLAAANRIARVLTEELGFRPGNRVLLRAANHPMLAASWFAALKAGGVAIATMPTLRARELAYMIDKARVRFAICDARLWRDLDEARRAAAAPCRAVRFGGGEADGLEASMAAHRPVFANVDTAAEDPAVIGFTSGSTGAPKATVHFHRDLLAAADSFIGHVVGIRPGDVVCGSPQIAFLYGLCAFLVDTPRFGAAAALVERATPDLLLDAIERYRATVCFSTPSGYEQMLDRLGGRDLSSLRVCVAGGEPLAKATFERWREATGTAPINGLGISELLHIFVSAAGADIRPGAIGKAVPGFRVRIVNDAMRDAAPGEVGQMIVKGPTGCRYLDDEERQERYVRDGWNLSGDLCRIDADGYVSFEARTDDMILTGGYNVSGLEVEAVLLEHPRVRACAVVASPDRERGQVVKAFVVPAGGAAAGETLAPALQDFVKARIAAFKYPRRVEFVAELPLTATGKIQRGALRRLERERAERGEAGGTG